MSNFYSNNIKQRLSLREPLVQALDVMAKLVEQLDLKNRTEKRMPLSWKSSYAR